MYESPSKLIVDFETRSTVDLSMGAWLYAKHPTTEVLCLAVLETNSGEVGIWYPDKFRPEYGADVYIKRLSWEELETLICGAETIEAHNAWFEKCIWEHIMNPLFRFRRIPDEKWRCTAALACYYALPRSLKEVCSVLELDTQKDMDGNALCRKMCKPRRPLKKEIDSGISPDAVLWHEMPQEIGRLHEYCVQDVRTEHALSQKLGRLPRKEQELWFLDQNINRRGVAVDMAGIEALAMCSDEAKSDTLQEFKQITEGLSPAQSVAFKNWLCSKGYPVESTRKDVLLSYPEPENPAVKRALQLKFEFSVASIKKLDKMLLKADDDMRVRENFQYHRAVTGRWGGLGIQMHNLPRSTIADVDGVIEDAQHGSDFLYAMYGEAPTALAKKCLRGMFVAEVGKTLIAADLSAIEGRVLAWLSEEKHILEAYANHEDVYCIAASSIYGIPKEKIDKSQRQVGKVCELALGYQGWTGALVQMASSYGLELPDDEEQKEIILNWRANRPATTAFWKQIASAVALAIQKPDISMGIGNKIHVIYRDPFLKIRLPAGRCLHYFKPKVEAGIDRFGRVVENISYMGTNAKRGYRWERIQSYGGKFTENIVQAIARDVLATGMFAVEKAGMPVIMHVHDEIVSEIPEGQESRLKEYEELMSISPDWAKDLPLAAKGWVGRRYRKE